MTKPEWNSFDDLLAENLQLVVDLDKMAAQLIGVTDQRNQYMARLEKAREALRLFLNRCNQAEFPELTWAECIQVGQAAIRETEVQP